LSYIYIPKIAQGIIKTYTLKEENNFQPDIEEIKAKTTEKTKMIVLISPNNPIGSILDGNSLNAIAEYAKENNLLVISDEIYERLIYGDEKNISIASLPGMKERTIVLNGFSKYFAMTGWRLGYIATNKTLIDPMFRFCFYNTTSANAFVQRGAVAALNQSNQPSENMKKEYQKRRDYLVAEINKIDRLSCLEPKGAFYVFVNIKKTGMDCESFANYLLEEEGIATVPGTNFGKSGEGFIRISYATSYENIVRAIPRIKAAVDKLT
jgi:aspartate/methionine/tyrosine aminotransferase